MSTTPPANPASSSVPTTWCPSCAKVIPGDAMFCDGCGASLADPMANFTRKSMSPQAMPATPTANPDFSSLPTTWCPSCAKVIPGDALICDGCGASLADPMVTLANAGIPPAATSPLSDAPQPYASFLQRLAAHLIDQTAIFAAAWFVGRPLGGMIGGAFYATGAQISWDIMAFVGALLVAAFTSFVFEVFWIGSHLQATPGKRAMGIKVTNLRGTPISFAHAFGRYMLKGLSGSVFCIGFLIQPYTEKKQALHDMLGGTLVVKR